MYILGMSLKIPSSIALELVPRSLDALLEECHMALQRFPQLQAINIPEINRVPIKSLEASLHLRAAGQPVIPHFRTIDRSLEELERVVGLLVEQGLQQVLLISGDPPKDKEHFISSGVTPVMGVRALKKRFPALKVYTGLDGYRQSFRRELDYCFEKLDAGADGFFTQPFFSEGLLGLWMEQLPQTEIWVGVSPVTTESSRKYWERVNQVVFPPDFTLDLEFNCLHNRRLLHMAAEAGQNAYLMPITISAAEYLAALFS